MTIILVCTLMASCCVTFNPASGDNNVCKQNDLEKLFFLKKFFLQPIKPIKDPTFSFNNLLLVKSNGNIPIPPFSLHRKEFNKLKKLMTFGKFNSLNYHSRSSPLRLRAALIYEMASLMHNTMMLIK